jgi:hypothetical protein
MGHALQITEPAVFEREDCCSCGVIFFVPADMQQRAKRDGRPFYCPNGHGQSYSQTEVVRLRKELEAEQRRKTEALTRANEERQRREETERRLSAQFGENTKLRKRIANGVCPCCHRTVSQLARHMKTKHPKYVAESSGGSGERL